MPLHPKKDFEFIKDLFKWIETEGVIYEEYETRWKKQLAEEIRELIRIYENREVKFESVYRNINRMIAYYEKKGAQARSGRRYLKYLEIIFKERFERSVTTAHAFGGGIAQRFLSLEDARIYAEPVPEILKIYPDPDTKLWVVLRYPS